jgi:hypothetical protein
MESVTLKLTVRFDALFAAAVGAKEEDDRTTPIGLFNYAHSYWKSAKALHGTTLRVTHPHAPVLFLYTHSIELYLKAFLRATGISVAELRSKKYGHQICRLAEAARSLGFFVHDEDLEVFSVLQRTDTLDLRYIRTGPFTHPTPEALDRVCRSLHETVTAEFAQRGLPERKKGT